MNTQKIHQNASPNITGCNEEGFILVLSLMALVMVSLLGAWALTTSTFEIKISGNEQIREANFNISEGSVNLEGTKVGFTTSTNFNWYNISDPSTTNQILIPPINSTDYDPGSDLTSSPSLASEVKGDDSTNWPRQNLLSDTADDQFDYAYLVTYLYPDIPPKGYDASQFAAYKFRINGEQVTEIELGGIKIGVKLAI